MTSLKSVIRGKSSSEVKEWINEGFNIDDVLRQISESLFPVDNRTLSILQIIAEIGPSSEYQLGKIGKTKHYDLDRDSVRRRLSGTDSKMNLEALELVWLAKEEKFRTKSIKKLYNLTLKGILASLSRVKFEKTFQVNRYYELVNSLTDNKFHIADFSLQLAKYHVATAMASYHMNNFSLMDVTNLSDLFRGNVVKYLLYAPIPNPSVRGDSPQYLNYLEIGKRYFALRHLVKYLIISLVEDKNSPVYSNKYFSEYIRKDPSFKKKSNMVNVLTKIIFRDWHLYAIFADEITPEKFPLIDFPEYPVYDQKSSWLSLEDEINALAEKIFSKLNIQNPRKINTRELP